MTTTTTTTRTVIGTIDIEAGTIHDASYETASWYRTFEHPAQTCDVYLSGPQFVGWTIEGRTTHEHFPSSFGGLQTGGGTMGDCDKPSTHSVRPYNYNAAEMVEAGRITLNSGFVVEERFHDHHEFCMGYVTDYSAPIGHRYSPCGHERHLNAHHKPFTDRNDWGHLASGYTDEVTTKRHIRIVKAGE